MVTYRSVHVPVGKVDDFLSAVGSGEYEDCEIAFMFVELHAGSLSVGPTPVYRVVLKRETKS